MFGVFLVCNKLVDIIYIRLGDDLIGYLKKGIFFVVVDLNYLEYFDVLRMLYKDF